jgi:hypothetical protein
MNTMWGYALLLGGLCGFAGAQTQVSLRTQSKSVDLSALGPTKPMQTGAVLPGTCGIGEMFFLTTAAAGSNLYTCASANVWTGIVGTASLLAGTGTVLTTGGGSTTVAVDPAVIPTKAVVQATTSNIVTLTSSSGTTLTGTMNPTLGAYSDKQIVEFTWNQNCAGGAMTMAVDGLAATSLKKPDGITNLGTGDCLSGYTNIFSYDGTLGAFKLMGGGSSSSAVTGGTCTNQFVRSLNTAAVPTCNSVGTNDISANAVTSSKMAVVNTYRTCDVGVGDTSGAVITNGQLGPQVAICFMPAAATIVELDVRADAGTPNIIVGLRHSNAVSNIVSAALATAAAGGRACSNSGGTLGLDGLTICSATLQNTSIAAGDYLELVSGTAGGTAKWMTMHVTYTIN